MDQQQLIDRLEARAADVPVGAPPIDAMRAAARRRRTHTTVLAVAASVALIAGAGIGWQAFDAGPDPQPSTASDLPVDPDVPPSGHRYVGIGTAVVAVPEAWGTNEASCGTPVEDTVVIDQGAICLALIPRPADVDSVRIEPYYEGIDISAWVERAIDGEPALWSPVSAEGGVTSGSVYVPSQQATFVAESSSADAQVVVNDLLTSIVMLQDHVTVPGFQALTFEGGERSAVEAYVELLQDLGLSHKVRPYNGDIVRIEPEVGSVVAPGDTVTVSVPR